MWTTDWLPATGPALVAPDVVLHRILVALDGTAGSDGALRLAGAIGRRTGAAVYPVTVVDDTESGVVVEGADPSAVAAEARWHRRHAAEEQVRRVGAAAPWSIGVVAGMRAAALASAAREAGADLLLTGAAHRPLHERLVRPDTTVALLDHAAPPVMAVPPDQGWEPSRVLVATDFGTESLHGALLAAALMPVGGTLYLVHVRGDRPSGMPIRERIWQMANLIEKQGKVPVEPLVLDGWVNDAVLGCAQACAADLLVVGNHAAGRFARHLLAHAPYRLVRDAACGVMVASSHEAQRPAA
jgi:nucleotide-binding universal stress UspA family protein